MRRWQFVGLLAVGTALLAALESASRGCPFCGGVQLTLSDELKQSEAAVIARRVPVKAPQAASQEPITSLPNDIPKTRFKIVEVIKGQEGLQGVKELEVLYFGQEPLDRLFLVQCASLQEKNWGTPLALSPRAVAYVRQLPGLPESGADRLAFFQDYFEDPDDLLARDAYDEFAKAPYSEVKDLKERMYHDKYVEWIKNPDVLTSRRRLYLTLLGVCGRDAKRPSDIALLEEQISAAGDEPKPALDAAIACYLTLKGPDGLPLVEDLFLKNHQASYSDTYAAIMALRFHGQEEEIIPIPRLLDALRHLLDRPELADLVIPDLARWQDWSAMDRLVSLFKNADEKSSWVRVPVIQYLMACPLPEAKEHIAELKKIDPDAVKRASFFIPLGKPAPPAAEAAEPKAEPEAAAEAGRAPQQGASPGKAGEQKAGGQKSGKQPTGGGKAEPPKSAGDAPTAGSSAAAPRRAPRAARAEGLGSWLVVALPACAGLGLLGMLVVVVSPARKSESRK